jgi:hypothetical protein
MLKDEFKKIAINPEHVVMVEPMGDGTIITMTHNKTVTVEGDFQDIIAELEQAEE